MLNLLATEDVEVDIAASAPWARRLRLSRILRGHNLTLLHELYELTPAERIERNCRMAELVEELRTTGERQPKGSAS